MPIIIVTGEVSQNETSESTTDDVLPSEPDDCFTVIMDILEEPENSSEISLFCDQQATIRKFKQFYLKFLELNFVLRQFQAYSSPILGKPRGIASM